MKLIHRKTACETVAERWEKAYRTTMKNPIWGPEKAQIYEKLKALDGKGTPDQIDAIIGNSSWTSNKCRECGEDFDTVILVGQDTDDYDDENCTLCQLCVLKAFDMIGAKIWDIQV